MKKIFSFFLSMLLIASMTGTAAAGESVPTLAVDTVAAKTGDTVQVAVRLQNNPGVISMTVQVAYDAASLTLIEVRDGRLLGVQTHKPEYKSPYTLAWVNDTATADFTADGVIATLTFTVGANAVEGVFYPITVSYNLENYDSYNKDLKWVSFTTSNGGIAVQKEQPVTPLSDFSYRMVNGEICLTGYQGSDSVLWIAESYVADGKIYPVSAIDHSAFAGNQRITSVSLPASVKNIGGYAFYNCTALTKVTLWSKYAEIGESAFGYYAISDNRDGKIDGFTLTAYGESAAQRYLKENELAFVAQTKPVGKGDIDVNGEFDSGDLVVMARHLTAALSLTGEVLEAADVNGDGENNVLDLICLKKRMTT